MNAISEQLTRHGQAHLLQFLDQLDPQQQSELLQQIDAINFDLIKSLFDNYAGQQSWSELASRAEPPPAIRCGDAAANSDDRQQAIETGQRAIADGKVAMILVAGGQGSRLGFDQPKGMYPIGPLSNKSLFQVQIESLQASGKPFGVDIPLYVMTSPATHQATQQFLQDHHWFGHPPQQCHLFCQGTMPAVCKATGELLLAEKGKLFLSPDGHGGMLAALKDHGGLERMIRGGVEQVFYCQIDNPLCQVCDAQTIGYHLMAGSELTLQAVPKTGPTQKVGNIVSIDGRVQIIEYSDLPEHVACQTRADGSLKLWAGSIAVHVFDVAFLDRMTHHADALPFHLAQKKVPYIDRQGNRIEPDEPNAIKFEKFIFDLLPMAPVALVVEVDADDAFSPVKNAPSEKTSTAKTAQQAMIDQARRRLSEVDVDVAAGVVLEISPLFATSRDELKNKLAGMSPITSDTYFH